MPDQKPEFAFTTPPVACLFGDRQHVLQLFPDGYTSPSEVWSQASLLVAADNAARALANRAPPPYLCMTCEAGTPEHQKARATLQAFLMESSPELITANLWQAAQRHQHAIFDEHRRRGVSTPFQVPTLVFHLETETEFALVQGLAPSAIAVEVVAYQPASEATMSMPGWPTRCTRIGARPDCPAWVVDAAEYYAVWARLARRRVLSLARASLSGSTTEP